MFYIAVDESDNITIEQWTFNNSCIKGHKRATKIIYNIFSNIEITEEIFKSTIINNHITIAKWLYQKNPTLQRTIDSDLFATLCFNGHIDMCKWILVIYPSLNISADNELAFRLACENGHLLISKWLLSRKQNINTVICNNYAYDRALANNHILLCSWLKRINKNHIYVDNIEICNICENTSDTVTSCNHQFCRRCITLWLQKISMCPYCRKEIEVNDCYYIYTM